MSKEKHQEGVCPSCGSSSIDLGDFETFSGDVGREWECRACNSFGVAYYDIKFGEYAIHGTKGDDDDEWSDE